MPAKAGGRNVSLLFWRWSLAGGNCADTALQCAPIWRAAFGSAQTAGCRGSVRRASRIHQRLAEAAARCGVERDMLTIQDSVSTYWNRQRKRTHGMDDAKGYIEPSFRRKVAFVTGGASAIGAAVSRTLARSPCRLRSPTLMSTGAVALADELKGDSETESGSHLSAAFDRLASIENCEIAL